MTPDLKHTLTACLVSIACHTSVAQAGLLEDILSVFKAPPAAERPAPVARPEPVVPARPAVVRQPPAQAPARSTVHIKKAPLSWSEQKDLNERLWLAALQGDGGQVRDLIEQGANPASGTVHGETPLHVAASRGHLKSMIYLINHGASVNARTRNGWTPLHHAARFGHAQAVKYLLNMGAVPHIRVNDKGHKSPMEMAVDNGYLDVAAVLDYYSK